MPHAPYELILQSTGDGIYGVDLAGDTIFVNSAALKMLGRRESDVIGRPYQEILFRVAAKNYDFDSCPIRYVLDGGDIAHVNKEIFYPSDETQFFVEFICLPMTENGASVGAVVTFQDITERQDLDAAAARTRETALETARLKAAFLANVSHEVRTPLGGILGMSDLLLTTNLDAAQLRYVEMLKSSADSLLRLVNDLLDFSKAEAGKIDLEKEIFNPAEKLQNAVDFFAVETNRKNLFLTLDIDANVPATVRGDAGRLRQILNNLIGNAIKFTRAGGVGVRVERIAANDKTTTLRVIITDTGIGIAAKAQYNLFQPFAQADSSTTRQFGGTGLGLAICKELVQIMGGEIGMHSEGGNGAQFWFTIVFETIAEAQSPAIIRQNSEKQLRQTGIAAQQRIGKKKHIRARGVQKLKILVAEDNAVNQEIAVRMLEQMNCQVDVVVNGAEAVAAVKERAYDMVLMDCQMPILDGYEAVKQIREAETANRQTPIVALTANVFAAEIEKCFAAGMNDFLPKPLTRESLGVVLERFRRAAQFAAPPTKNQLLATIFEKSALERLLEIEERGEPNFAVEMLTLYLTLADEQSAILHAKIPEHDADAVRFAAHTLKGSSGNIGAMKIYELCAVIENCVQINAWNECAAAVAQIDGQIHNIKAVWSQVKTNHE